MPFDIGTLGMQAAGGVIDTAMGLALEDHNDKRQLRQQEKLQNLQIKGNKEMFDYQLQGQKEKELEMWKNTSYPAQMAMMKEAGLNPALMYGMGGGGGVTVGGGTGGTNITGSHAPEGGGEIMGLMAKSNLALTNAQIENIEAQTEKTKAETVKTAGVDTKLGETQIQSLTQGINNQKAVEILTNTQNRILSIEEEIKGKSKDDQIALIQQAVGLASEELNKLQRENSIGDETKQQKIDLIKAELTGTYLENNLKTVLTAKTAAEIGKIVHDIIIDWKKIGIENRKLDIAGDQQSLNKYSTMWDISQEDVKAIQKTVNEITQAIVVGGILKETKTRTEVKGFRY